MKSNQVAWVGGVAMLALGAGVLSPVTVPAAQAQESEAAPLPAQFTHFRVGQRNVKAIHQDGHIMWVGTSGGVIRYDSHAEDYELIDNRNGLLANGIFYVGELEGRIAVGTYGGGISLLAEDGSWDTYNVPDGLGDAFVYDAALDSQGDLWIATWSGINRVRGGVESLDQPEQWDLYTVANSDGGLPNDWVYALAPAEDGTVWMATEGGLAAWRDGEWESWKHEDGLGAPYALVRDAITFMDDPAQVSDHHSRQKDEMGFAEVDVAYNANYVVALELDAEGGVWTGTWGGGLSHFDGEQWTTLTTHDGLPSNHVFALHRDSEDRLWIGTSDGLARLDGKDAALKLFTTEHGLFSDLVFSITTVPDQDALWVGSYGGIARLVGLQ
ncbi:two-component regulator propeller domain-containing protein [Halomonas sp. DQ26W]|uniref:ligand-binding sensor domain-containing protein n=1 Tax=Halomonas sp. DQ26W TaxID=2282311 RepID=UPI0015F0E3C6|nr:two-component regulator propeller domain-containing protein [Halomonas sp. DQ26W]